MQHISWMPPPSNVYLVGKDDFVFGMSRMFQLLASGLPNTIEVYREIDVACAELGIPVEVIEGLRVAIRHRYGP